MRDLRWLIPFAAIVFLGSRYVNGGMHGHPTPGWQWACVVVAVLAALAAGLSRRAPQLAVSVSGLLVAVYFLLGGHNGPIYLTLIVATFASAWRWPTRKLLQWAVLGVLLANVGVLVGRVTVRSGGNPLPPFSAEHGRGWATAIALTSMTAAAGAIGAWLRDRSRARAQRARLTVAQEQLRMAQDLHDGVGHGLAVIAMQAGVALHVIDSDPPAARASLEAIRETSIESLEALRAELSRLRPGEEPATRAPRPGLDQLDVLVNRLRGGGLDVTVQRAAPAEPLPTEVDETGYVVVQEALTNVLRHAHATSATVSCAERDGALLVIVDDDGQGGPVQEGMGLSGMRRQVERLGGSLAVGPTANGFRVAATLPLDPAAKRGTTP